MSTHNNAVSMEIDASSSDHESSDHFYSDLQKDIFLHKTASIQKSLKQCCERFYQDLTEEPGITPLALEQWLNDNDANLKDHLKEAMFLFNAQGRSHGLLDHHFAVLNMCLGLADLVNLSKEMVYQLATAALFHDVGWMKLPANLFSSSDFQNKNHVKLWQAHVTLSSVYFSKSNIFTPEVRYLIENHHHDITPPPFNLNQGDSSGNGDAVRTCHFTPEISNELKLALNCLQICDFYDESQQGIGGRTCLSPTAALREIFRLASEDNAFDEIVAIRFIQLMTIYPLGSMVKLSDGRIGQVVSANSQQPNKPTVFISSKWNQTLSTADGIDITLNLEDSSLIIEHEIRKTDFPHYGIYFRN